MLCAPAVIVMIAVTAYPILYAIWLSLQRYDLRFPSQAKFTSPPPLNAASRKPSCPIRRCAIADLLDSVRSRNHNRSIRAKVSTMRPREAFF